MVKAVAPLTVGRRIEKDVQGRLKMLTFPELKLAMRGLQKMIADRLASDPEKCRREMDAFDGEHPEEVIYY